MVLFSKTARFNPNAPSVLIIAQRADRCCYRLGVTWAFLFEGFPYFEGFRDLATNGIDKPVLNAFRMLGMLRGFWVEAKSNHALGLDKVMANGVSEALDGRHSKRLLRVHCRGIGRPKLPSRAQQPPMPRRLQ